jgi:tetratricopeptide (TPR) repeat protein
VLLREAAYAALTAADQKLAHSLAARWLAARGGADPMTLATHYERAGDPRAACEYFVAAAEQSLEGSDTAGALERLARAEASGASGDTLGKLLLVRADVSRWRGDHVTMRDCAHRATKLLAEGTSEWLVAKMNEAVAAASLADTKPAEALATLLCILLEGGDVSGPAVWAAGRTCHVLAQRYVPASVTKRLVDAITTARLKCKDTRAVGMVFAALSTEAAAREALEDSIDFGNRSVASFTSAGDVRNACNTRMNTAYTLMMLGQWQRARDELDEGLVTAERAGLLATAATVKHNLGLTLFKCGSADAAEAMEREAIRALEQQKDPRLEGGARFYLGRILIARGRVAEAEAEMRRAADVVANVGSLVPLVRSGLVFALLGQGKREEALACAREAAKLAADRGDRVDEPRTVKLALAQALVATGHSDEAATIVAPLAIDLLDRASRLRDPENRRSFLHDVEDHARIFTLQQALARTE